MPVPTSSTRDPSSTRSSPSIRAVIEGMEFDDVAIPGPPSAPSSSCVTTGSSLFTSASHSSASTTGTHRSGN
ncbi:hypothetical protein ACFWRG_33500 [Micromonospora tulbaghiae]|uniref:hypothetical protein n=1 Tax=Micromonospora tulbaghiae TaxID=479978 RepID=UPI00365EBE13